MQLLMEHRAAHFEAGLQDLPLKKKGVMRQELTAYCLQCTENLTKQRLLSKRSSSVHATTN